MSAQRIIDRDRLRELHATGMAYADIAAELGCSTGTVRQTCSMMKLRRKGGALTGERAEALRRLTEQGMLPRDIATELSISQNSIYTSAKRLGIELNVQDRPTKVDGREREFRALHALGRSDPEMAKEMGLTVEVVRRTRERFGLPINRHVRRREQPTVEPRKTFEGESGRQVNVPHRKRARPEEVVAALGEEVGSTSCARCGTTWHGGTLLDQARRFKTHECVTATPRQPMTEGPFVVARLVSAA